MRNQHASTAATKRTLVTANELADMLQISIRHLHRLKSRGDVIPPVKIGKLIRWSLEDVELWIRNGCPTQSRSGT